MAKSSGLGDNFYVGGFDLSGDVTSLDKISGPMAPLEATAIKQSAEARLFGLRDGMMQFTTYFDNTGTTSTPSFPLSNNPVTNPNGWIVLVTITGGTLTNVLVNGVSVGTTAGTYAVPAFGTIAITYSVAPSWAWVGVGAEHNALKTLPTSDTQGMYFRGTTVGNAAACINGVQLNYDPTRDAKGALTLQVEINADKFGLEWGIMMTPGLRVDTAAASSPASFDPGLGFANPAVPASGTPVTNTTSLPATVVITGGTMTAVTVSGVIVGSGAGTYTVNPGQTITLTYTVAPTWQWTLVTNFGGQAYMQLTALVGTSVDVVLQHSSDNTTFSNLIDFGAQAATGAFRGSVSNTTTVNRYLRVTTAGTFTYAQFAVMFNRNPIAGVVF